MSILAFVSFPCTTVIHQVKIFHLIIYLFQNNSLERVSFETLNSCLEICPEECTGQLSSLLVLLLNKVQILPQNSPAMVISIIFLCLYITMNKEGK